MHDLAELREEACRAALAHLLPARTADRGIGRHEQHGLASRGARRRVARARVSAWAAKRTASAPDLAIRARAVEDDDAARAAHGHEARELVDERVPVGIAARVEEVRPVEQVERDVGSTLDLESRSSFALATGLEERHRRRDAHVERLDAGRERDRDGRRRRCAARADAPPCPRRRRRARRRRVRSSVPERACRRPRPPRTPRGGRSSPRRGSGRGSGTTATGRCSTAPADERQTAGVTAAAPCAGTIDARRARAGGAADDGTEVPRVGHLVEAGRAAACSAAASSHASA